MVGPCSETDEDGTAQQRHFCVVCQDHVTESEPTSTTPCGHVFHFSCLARAMNGSEKCPVCREDFFVSDSSNSSEADISLTSDGQSGIDIEISALGASGTAFQELVDRLEGHTLSLGIYASPPSSTVQAANHNARPPLPPSAPPPTPANIIRFLRTGNVCEVENMLSHNSRLMNASDEDGDTLLHLAVVTQNEYMVRYLATNTDIPINSTNKFRMTPLHYAVFASNVGLVEHILGEGGFVDAGDASGKTPLMHAAMADKTEIVQLLLRKDASVNAADAMGDTALHHACRGRCVSSVRLLATSPRFDVGAENCLGETALHAACLGGSLACIRFLIISGASTVHKTKAGRVPRDYQVSVNAGTLNAGTLRPGLNHA